LRLHIELRGLDRENYTRRVTQRINGNFSKREQFILRIMRVESDTIMKRRAF